MTPAFALIFLAPRSGELASMYAPGGPLGSLSKARVYLFSSGYWPKCELPLLSFLMRPYSAYMELFKLKPRVDPLTLLLSPAWKGPVDPFI